MVVDENEPTGPGGASPVQGSAHYATWAYAEGQGLPWPVSGDLIAQDGVNLNMRQAERTALAGTRRTVVAAGRLRRPTDPNRVQCLDCPWGLTVHGWDSGADRLAQRHADARGHHVEAAVC